MRLSTSTTENEVEFPETLSAAVKHFANPETALAFMVSLRWSDGVIRCPRCQSEKTTFLATRKVSKCKGCAKQFSVKVGTIFEDSPLGLHKWLPAVWVIVNAKNGVSSCELARSLGVTQKTAWFMLHRIRTALQTGNFDKDKMTGTVEVDESYIGGRARNLHAHVKREKMQVTLNKSLTPERTEVHTDALRSYTGLAEAFTHKVVDHPESYVKTAFTRTGSKIFGAC